MTEHRRRKRRAGLLVMLLGCLMVLSAAGLTGWNLWQGKQAGAASADMLDELAYRTPPKKLARSSVADYVAHADAGMPLYETAEDVEVPRQMEIPLYLLAPQIPMPCVEIDGREYVGTIAVPILGIELPVLNDCTFSGLRIAPTRWSGSAYTSDLVICAHNYQRHFGTLKNLQPDDRVTFTDMDGNLFVYRVAVVEVLQPENVEEMENSEYDLTLYTCTIGGATRVTVRCIREEE